MPKSSRHLIGLSILLLLITFAIFGKTLGFGFVPFDDPAYVTQNGYINRGLTSQGLAWSLWYAEGGQSILHDGVANLWHPLTWISHMLDVSLFGLDGAWGHHLINILLHSFTAIAFLLLAFRFSGSLAAAFIVALLWAIHPLKVESVAWISERKDVLSGFFAISAMACALLAHHPDRSKWRALGLTLFALALLSKPSVVILPGLLILFEGTLEKERTWNLRFWIKKARRYQWWILASLITAIITVLMQSSGSHGDAISQSSLTSRLLTLGLGQWFYLWRTLVPWNLTIDYPYPSLGIPLYLAAWAALIVAAGAIWFTRSRFPNLFFGAAWWALCILPMSGLVYVGSSFTCDRYLYLASAGPLLALLPWLKARLAQQRNLTLGILTLLSLAWSALSLMQVETWRNGWTLFQHTVKAQPKSSLGWSNVGTLYQREGQSQKALAHHQKAIALRPTDHIAHYNIAYLMAKAGDEKAAISSYQQSLKYSPSYLPALQGLALLHFQNRRMSKAIPLLQRATELTADRDPRILTMLCEAQFAQGNLEEGSQVLQRLEALSVTDPQVQKSIANARAFLQRQPRR